MAGNLSWRAYVGALLALTVLTAVGVFCNGLFFVSQPYQLNYGEGLVAWQAAHITDPARAYAPLDHYPFVVFQYPPLFHLVTRVLAGDLVAAGRTVSLLCAAILCIVIGWTTFVALPRRARWQMRLLAAAFAGALPTTFYNFHWTWLARVDTLAALLSFSGVALFAARPRSAAIQMTASVMMVAALFTRQTALAGPLACLFVALLIDRRIALRMLLTMSILGGGVLAWLAVWSHGQVILHLFRYNQTAFSISRAAFGLLMNTRHMAGPMMLAAGAAWGVLRGGPSIVRSLRANRYRRSVMLLTVYSVLAILSAVAFGKEGSDINYFLEWNISLAPLVGILVFRAVRPIGSVLRLAPATLAVLAVPLLLLGTGFDQARDGWLRIFRGPLHADRQQYDEYRRMISVVNETPGPVFSEDMNLLYKTGKDIPAEPAMIQCLDKAGLWDERPFVRMIQERRFALVVTMVNRETGDLFSRSRHSPGVASAIGENYQQTVTIGDYLIFRPKRP